MTLSKLIAATSALALLAGVAAAQETGPNGLPIVGGAEMSPDKTIVGNAANSADHTTLVAAVEAAGLVETLTGPGPFTVFAPVNAAFEALPAGTVDTLLEPANQDQLTEILTCHVVAGDVMSDAISQMVADDGGAHEVETLGGCILTAEATEGGLTLTDEAGTTATVTIADVEQLNGVIHVIDAVMLPAPEMPATGDAAMSDDAAMSGDAAMADDAAMAEEAAMSADAAMQDDTAMTNDAAMADSAMAGSGNPMVGGAEMFDTRDIVDNAVNSADHTTLVAAVTAAGLVETLKGPGPFTVFAPTDAAFEALPAGTVETLLEPRNKDALTKVLTAHVVPGRLTAEAIAAGIGPDGFYHMQTVSGDALSAQITPSGSVFIFDEHGEAYRVSTADVMQSNGVIHVVDGVLLPR